MRDIKKLFVFGCSLSDRTDVDHSYGDILKTIGNFDEYIHEGAGVGSNDRIYRKIYNYITNKTLTPKDTIIIQLTQTFREEVISYSNNFELLAVGKHNKVPINLREKYNEEYAIIRFKPFRAPHGSKHEQDYFSLKESYFTNKEWSDEKHKQLFYALQTMLLYNNIKNVIILLVDPYVKKDQYEIIKEYKNNVFETTIRKEHYLSHNDDRHYNQQGHQYLAEQLECFLNERNNVS
jgi:hypothetical protein